MFEHRQASCQGHRTMLDSIRMHMYTYLHLPAEHIHPRDGCNTTEPWGIGIKLHTKLPTWQTSGL